MSFTNLCTAVASRSVQEHGRAWRPVLRAPIRFMRRLSSSHTTSGFVQYETTRLLEVAAAIYRPVCSIVLSALVMGATLFVLGSGLVLPASGQVGDQNSKEEALAKSPLRWDDLKANRDPQPHLFAGEYLAGMLRRPEQLTPDTWFHDGHLRTFALLNLSDVVRTVEISRGKEPVFMFGNARVPALLDEVSVTFEHKEFPRSGQPIPLRERSEA